ncbi:MAG: class I SAM-dependent methyltransferase [Candidatus Goldiibacteriota bacterium]
MNIFDKKYREYDEWYEKNRFLFLSEAAAVKKAMPKKGRFLEIGAGTGRFAEILGIKEGIDISKNMLKAARARGIRTVCAPAENLPFEDGVFDCVVFIVTLCFVKDPEKALNEAYRVLKSGGIVIAAVIDKNSRIGKKCRNKKSVFYENAAFFTAAEIKKMLKNAGFNVDKTYRTLFAGNDNRKIIQKAVRGSGKGSFVVISAEKGENGYG